jgi:hypothetical protein
MPTRSIGKLSAATQPLTKMLRRPLTCMFALAMASRATPILPYTNLYQRNVNMDTQTEDHQLSTEAIIGVVGVVVAVLGIASSLAWSKRRKSRSRSRRTSEGTHMSKVVHFKVAELTRFARIGILKLSDT